MVDVVTLSAMMQVDFPAATVRLCDGGFVDYAGNRFFAKHAVFGTVAAVEVIEESIDDLAPGGSFTLAPSPDAALSAVFSPNNQNARVQMWLGEVGSDLLTVTTAEKLFDGFIDYQRRDVVTGLIENVFVSTAERLFLRNEGNDLSPAFHKSIWPGETGNDFATDTPAVVAWGIENTTGGSTISGGGGSGGNTQVRRLLS